MKEVELKKYEIVFRGVSGPTSVSVNSGHSELDWSDEKWLFQWKNAAKGEN